MCFAEKDLSDLPPYYRKSLEILDHQLTRLFSLLHHMVIHEDVEYSSLQTVSTRADEANQGEAETISGSDRSATSGDDSGKN